MFFTKGQDEPEKYTGAREKQAIVDFVKKGAGEAVEEEPEEEDNGEIAKDGDVLTLTKGNFDRALGDHKHVLVKFYAPWCGHCKKLAPVYKEAATALAVMTDQVFLADLDCTVHQAVCGKYGVKGYPTVLLFKNNKVRHRISDFEGDAF